MLNSNVKNIILISSGQPTANPRLVKEATALDSAGYNVTVIYVPISTWADKFDEELFNNFPTINFVKTGFHPYREVWKYRWARMRRKAYFSLYRILGDIFNISDYSLILFGQELLKKALKHKADLYIAHNLGALPVAVKAAKYFGAKVSFDAEDFHRGEMSGNSQHFKITKLIEDKYFPLLTYFTAASPKILQYYSSIYSSNLPCVINNVFPKKHLVKAPLKSINGSTLKLFWFSQTIGKDRGIEDVIKAVCIYLKDEPVEITLLGNCSPEMENYLDSLVPGYNLNLKVTIVGPVPGDRLFEIANQHHIGLALEPGRDVNNNIALSNKIFTYMLAGNALILSDTDAQAEFYNTYANIGSLYTKGDTKMLATVIAGYINDRDLLYKHQLNCHKIAGESLNWDEESRKFLSLVDKVLSS